MKAARNRREALDHVLLTGPPGLSKSQNENPAAFYCLAAFIERSNGSLNHIIGHLVIDFAGKFNEFGGHPDFPGFPCQIKWVDGNAVAAQTRARIKRLKAEGFCGG